MMDALANGLAVALAKTAKKKEEEKDKKSGDKKDEKGGKDGKDKKKEPEDEPLTVPEEVGIREGMRRIYTSKQFWDVSFAVGESKQIFTAHRAILAARSPVFEAMFYSKFAESTDSSAVPVPDLEPEAFEQLLSSIYVDVATPEINSVNVMNALFAAKKYAVEPLRVACVELMSGSCGVDNACFVLDNGSQLLDEEVFALKFIEDKATEIVKTKGWLETSKRTIKRIVGSEYLRIKETELYQAVLKWADAELRRVDPKNKPTPAARKALLSDITPLIRFPLFPMEELATVSQAELLEATDLLPLFTYCATKIAPPTGTIKFNMNKRTPRRPLSFFRWSDTLKHASVQLKNEGTEASCAGVQNWISVCGDKTFAKGTGLYEWEVKLDAYDATNTYNVCVGIVPAGWTQYATFQSPIGYSGGVQGWSIITGNGQKCNNSGPQGYNQNQVFRANDRVGLRLDTDAGTLSYLKNGKDLGVAFTNVNEEVRPGLSFIINQRTTLSFDTDDWDEPKEGSGGGGGKNKKAKAEKKKAKAKDQSSDSDSGDGDRKSKPKAKAKAKGKKAKNYSSEEDSASDSGTDRKSKKKPAAAKAPKAKAKPQPKAKSAAQEY